MNDEPLLSPRRLWGALRVWLWYMTREPPVNVPLRTLVRYHRRPFAARHFY